MVVTPLKHNANCKLLCFADINCHSWSCMLLQSTVWMYISQFQFVFSFLDLHWINNILNKSRVLLDFCFLHISVMDEWKNGVFLWCFLYNNESVCSKNFSSLKFPFCLYFFLNTLLTINCYDLLILITTLEATCFYSQQCEYVSVNCSSFSFLDLHQINKIPNKNRVLLGFCFLNIK